MGDIKPLQDKITSSLKPSNVEDKLFLQQISTINALTEKIQSLEKLPKFITIRLSLTPLITSHTLVSPAVTDAMKLLSNAVEDLTEATEKAYNNGAVVAVVTVNDDTLTRSKRATAGAKQSDVIVSSSLLSQNCGIILLKFFFLQPENLNLALSYSDDYPVIFNIILWFSVVIAFSLLAISYTIGYMDPGRDSIIYRMTSTRMKKDN